MEQPIINFVKDTDQLDVMKETSIYFDHELNIVIFESYLFNIDGKIREGVNRVSVEKGIHLIKRIKERV